MKVSPKSTEKCLADYRDSLEELKEIRDLAKLKGLDEKLEQKIIRSFEVTHELALITMSEYFKREGRKLFSGSRDVTVEAFHEDLIDDGEGWLDMVIGRIKYNPIYPADYQPVLVQNILGRSIKLFENFERKMSVKLGD